MFGFKGITSLHIFIISQIKTIIKYNLSIFCEYFKITPKEFFDEDIEHPVLIHEIVKESKNLDKQSLESILTLIKNIKNSF